MIGVDTNVLVRLFVEDDEKQSEAAKLFFAARSPSDPAVISFVVVAELVWVLRNPYSFNLERVADLLAALLESGDFLVERREIVEAAITLARGSRVDIADCLISAIAADLGATSTATFDRGAARHIPGMELLK